MMERCLNRLVHISLMVVVAMVISIPLGSGIKTTRGINKVQYHGQRELFHYVRYAEVERVKQCTSLRRPFWATANEVIESFLL